VEVGSNTSTVTLRVVGGDEKESLKYETVIYGREYQGARTRERLRWQEPAAYTKDRPVLSSERAPHKKQERNCHTEINIWSWAIDGARYQDLLTD
jgi:IS5 family transposase